jgi:hypothetical protein
MLVNMLMIKMIYKLNLNSNKFYFSTCPAVDNEWIRHYGIISYETCEGSDIDLIYWVLTFMSHYGYNNVRGGYWNQTEPYKNPPPVLMRFIKGKTKYNRCERCQNYGHSTSRCVVKLDDLGDVIM